jgi:hypothetical protein
MGATCAGSRPAAIPVTGIDRDADAIAAVRDAGRALQADIENGPWPLAGETFAGVVVTNYLWRPCCPPSWPAWRRAACCCTRPSPSGNETVGKPSRPISCCARASCWRPAAAARGGLRRRFPRPRPDRFVQRIAAVREPAGNGGARYPL